MEGVHNNASAFIKKKRKKKKRLMAKVNFLNQYESFFRNFSVTHIRKPENEGTSFRE